MQLHVYLYVCVCACEYGVASVHNLTSTAIIGVERAVLFRFLHHSTSKQLLLCRLRSACQGHAEGVRRCTLFKTRVLYNPGTAFARQEAIAQKRAGLATLGREHARHTRLARPTHARDCACGPPPCTAKGSPMKPQCRRGEVCETGNHVCTAAVQIQKMSLP